MPTSNRKKERNQEGFDVYKAGSWGCSTDTRPVDSGGLMDPVRGVFVRVGEGLAVVIRP